MFGNPFLHTSCTNLAMTVSEGSSLGPRVKTRLVKRDQKLANNAENVISGYCSLLLAFTIFML